jgi:hypothetical protein
MPKVYIRRARGDEATERGSRHGSSSAATSLDHANGNDLLKNTSIAV